MHEITIGKRTISEGHRPFIIAEMSGNHNHSLERAMSIVDAAAKAGADALKIQTYTPDTMTLDIADGDFHISDSNSLWHNQSLYSLYGRASTPWEWHSRIFEHCIHCGLVPFSTPFDQSAVKFLEQLQVPLYKIASFENSDLPLIREVAKTGKPVIISTGLATIAELDESVRTVRDQGNDNLVLLKCTSSYPASPSDSNLRTLPHLRELFNTQVGISDHTLGIGAAVASVALGATVIEKHFTLSRIEGGVDAAFSLEPSELSALVQETGRAWQALGIIRYGASDGEKDSLKYRRSLYVAADMNEGDSFTTKNLRAIRPGFGLSPKYFDTLLGRKVCRAIRTGTPVNWDMLG